MRALLAMSGLVAGTNIQFRCIFEGASAPTQKRTRKAISIMHACCSMLRSSYSGIVQERCTTQNAGLACTTGRCRKRKTARCLPYHGLYRNKDVSMQQSGNVVVSGIVSAMTESLRLLGVGKQQYQQIAQQQPLKKPLAPGDIAGVMSRIEEDYTRSYFVTGVIDDSIYDPNCTFADPTVQFSGLDLWKRNLQLLVPFLIAPQISLKHIQQVEPDQEGAQQVKADWVLQTTLALPWRPFIEVMGSTVYTLNPEANKVVLHVESWDITAFQALLQVFTPGGGRQHDGPEKVR